MGKSHIYEKGFKDVEDVMPNIALGEVCHMEGYFQIQYGVAIRITELKWTCY